MKNRVLKIKLNSDKELVQEIKNRLVETRGYCPCVNPLYYSSDYKCPCRVFREKETAGECHCGLYVKVWK